MKNKYQKAILIILGMICLLIGGYSLKEFIEAVVKARASIPNSAEEVRYLLLAFVWGPITTVSIFFGVKFYLDS